MIEIKDRFTGAVIYTFSGATLSWADLSGAKLSGASLSGADLSGANLSGAKGLPDTSRWFAQTFKKTKEGIIVYKCFDGAHSPNQDWKIQPGAIITENCNPNPTEDCGCGVNFATLEWVKRKHPNKEIWTCLIKWQWLVGVVVPYNTDGKARCSRLQILRRAS